MRPMPINSAPQSGPPRRAASDGVRPTLRSVPAEPPSVTFAHAVRAVGQVARRRDLQVPVFRSPPTLPDVDRTLRRTAAGGAVVAVRLVGRPAASIQADVVDGVIATNSLTGLAADRFRRAAWSALEGHVGPPVQVRSHGGVAPVSDPNARVA